MALSAKNKAGADYQSPEGTTMRTPDILAAFSLLGNILGIIAAFIGFGIAFGHRWHPVIVGGVLSPSLPFGVPSFMRLPPLRHSPNPIFFSVSISSYYIAPPFPFVCMSALIFLTSGSSSLLWPSGSWEVESLSCLAS